MLNDGVGRREGADELWRAVLANRPYRGTTTITTHAGDGLAVHAAAVAAVLNAFERTRAAPGRQKRPSRADEGDRPRVVGDQLTDLWFGERLIRLRLPSQYTVCRHTLVESMLALLSPKRHEQDEIARLMLDDAGQAPGAGAQSLAVGAKMSRTSRRL